MNKDTKNKFLAVVTFLTVIVIAIALIQLVGVGIDLLKKKLGVNNANTEVTQEPNKNDQINDHKLSLYPDYYVIKGDKTDPNIKVVKLTADCPENGCVNNSSAIVDFDGIRKAYKVTGQFSRAYLYAEVAVDGGRPLTSFDDFYFKVNDFLGGHIIKDGNLLPVPESDDTVYLLNLKSISTYADIQSKRASIPVNNIDIFSQLAKPQISFHVSVSSDRPGRVMKEVSVYYECVPNSECSIQ